MDKQGNSPNNPPMPFTTKKASKRRKHLHNGNKPHGIRKPNAINLIYKNTTGCIIADEATEARLKRLETTTSPRHGGMQFIW